jgi:hypothetical protein
MEIVLDERKKAEDVLSSADSPANPIQNVFLLAKYYYSLGQTRAEVLAHVEEYLQRFPYVVLPKWQTTVERMVTKAKKHKLVEIQGIPITKTELEAVVQLQKESLQKLAFTLLCIAKFYNAINPNNQNWCNTSDKDLFRMANIGSLDSRRQQKLISELHELGMVGYSNIIDNINLRVMFIDQYEEIGMVITSYEDLGLQYLEYIGDKTVVRCKDCGKLVKKRSKRLDYCPECALRNQREKTAERCRKHRNRDM